jgi:hypothetical protein
MIRRTCERQVFRDGRSGAISAMERVEEECLFRTTEQKGAKVQNPTNRLARLVRLWLDPSFLETNILSYRKRACRQAGERFKDSFSDALEEEVSRLEVSVRKCPDLQDLFDEPFARATPALQHRPGGEEGIAGSEFFQIALSNLARRRRKRKAIARIESRFAETGAGKRIAAPRAESYRRGTVRILKCMPYPLSASDIRVLSANEEETVGIQAHVYEKYIRTALESQGRSRRLLAPLLQQAITLKMLFPESFPWKLPPITELKGFPQKRKYSSVAFMPLGFYGKQPESATYFCSCTLDVGGRDYPDVLLELPLLVSTREYRRKVLAVHFPEQIIPTTCGAYSGSMQILARRPALPSSG